MGERKLAPVKAMKAVASACQEAIDTLVEPTDEAMRVRTPGGVFSVRWDERGSATALGQLAFFAEYLEATGLFEAWLKSCPLSYTSPNAPELVDVLGTWMLSILDGHCRYAHVGALRGDGVAPSILGMNKIILFSSVTQSPRRSVRDSAWVHKPIFARRCSARGRTIAGVWSTAARSLG